MALFPNQVTTGADGVEEVTVTSPKSPFSINDFVSTVSGMGGLAKSNRFKVLFSHPVEYSYTIDFFCEAAEFPGRTFQTSDSRIYGPVYRTPFDSQYPEINLTFLCNLALDQKRYFDGWMDEIHRTSGGTGSMTTMSGGARAFFFEYRDNYVKDIDIQQLSEDGSVTYAVKLLRAFPIAVAPLQVNWSDDQFHKLQVTFAYDYWEMISDQNATEQSEPSQSLG
jgi:hypothetical protein